MKIALLGGTFNPVHNGHLLLADQVRLHFKYDKIVFVPSYIPAHKNVDGIVTPEERLEMLVQAVGDTEWADFSDCEIQRKGISYTADTLDFISKNYNLSDKPGLIIGDDLAAGFGSWRNPENILKMADLIIAHRLHSEQIALKFPHKYINNDIFSLSSSQIRQMVKNGEDISESVPEKVYLYIKEKGLYLGPEKRH
jgi:nicotinate-nucleotide adenylyltransferase